MSPKPLNLSNDLRKLRDEGYEVVVRDGYLHVGHIPYVNASRNVMFGALVSKLAMAGEKTIKPDTHVAYFCGEFPCNKDGSPIEQLRHNSQRQDLGGGLIVDHSFSNKPPGGYGDYHEKITTYARILSAPAESLDHNVTARTFAKIDHEDDGSVFVYTDTNSSRGDINAISEKVRDSKVAIVGLGGTGAYVLDLLAKTPAREIHLFDGDRFVQHNAFRSPGAASSEELQETPFKTDYFKNIYSRMHKAIHSHPVFIEAANVTELNVANFVFICVDRGEARKLIVEHLEASGISFVDVGMGIEAHDGKLRGILRTTCSTSSMRSHLRNRASFEDGEDDAYKTNIQIAELNMLNAALAVVKWKKISGIYDDLEKEHNSTYTIDVNMLMSDDHEA